MPILGLAYISHKLDAPDSNLYGQIGIYTGLTATVTKSAYDCLRTIRKTKNRNLN